MNTMKKYNSIRPSDFITGTPDWCQFSESQLQRNGALAGT